MDDKYRVPVQGHVVDLSLPLHAIYLLKSHSKNALRIETVRGLEKFPSLQALVYRSRLGVLMGQRAQLRHGIAALGQVKVARVFRPVASFRLDELRACLEKDWMSMA